MLDAEQLIRDRLTAKVPGLRGVHSALGLTEQAVAGRQTPAAFVAADGYRVAQVTGQNDAASLALRWLVLIAVRNVAEIRSGHPAREEVDDIIEQTFRALCGWQPAPNHRPLKPIDPPRPTYTNGLLFYPLAFESGRLLQRLTD